MRHASQALPLIVFNNTMKNNKLYKMEKLA